MRGRKPEPSALRVLRGNPGKRPLNAAEPKPGVHMDLAPPAWMDDEAKAEWSRLAPKLARLGVLTETDEQALTAYCGAWVTWKTATQNIWKFGLVVKNTKDGGLPVVSPYVKIAHNAMMQLRAFLVEFGMTPSSRARIHAAPADQPAVSKWAGALE